MRVYRKASFNTIPWKNGGGLTHEVVRVPAGTESFNWRVSVADVDTSGPFSEFAECRRYMVLLRGNGLRLSFADRRGASLVRPGDWAEFDGAVPTRCDLADGPCVDLNLMVSKSMSMVQVRVKRLSEPLHGVVPAAHVHLIVAVDAPLSLDGHREAVIRLEPWELAVMQPGDRYVVGSAAPAPAAAPLVFCAVLDDNSGSG